MLYLIFSLVIAWVVYNIVAMSVRQKKQQQQIIARLDALENKVIDQPSK